MTQTFVQQIPWMRLLGTIAGASAFAFGSMASAPSSAALALAGGIYNPAGLHPGEQIASAVGLSPKGGLVVWQDNTIGKGFSIRGRLLAPDFSASSSPFVLSPSDSVVNLDQENPSVAARNDGMAAVAWQSGIRGHQNIKLRFITAGAFSTPELLVNGGTNVDEKLPTLTFLNDGSLVVAWHVSDVSQGFESPSIIEAQRFSSTGQKLGTAFQVDDNLGVPQRSASLTSLPNGGFAVAWISEQDRGNATADVRLKTYDSTMTQTGSQRANASGVVCDTPRLTHLDSGQILAVWTQINPTTTSNWVIGGKVFDSLSQAQTATFVMNAGANGHQLDPHIASSGTEAMVVWRMAGDLTVAPAIMGATVATGGVVDNSLVQLSGGQKGNVFYPHVGALSSGKYLATWSAYSSFSMGDDIFAQRVQRVAIPLDPPAAPFVYPLAPTRLVVSWAGVQGQAVDHYDVFLDGGNTAISTNGQSIVTPAFLPGSVHSATLRYVLRDGRTSPLSAASAGTTWGEDANGDGLPDDWEARYFGSEPSKWPSPSADSDGDGVSNRDEFFAGTIPISAVSVLKLKMVDEAGGKRLSWNSLAGRTYILQSSKDLEQWSAYGDPVLSVSDTVTVPLSFDANGTYFRVNLIR